MELELIADVGDSLTAIRTLVFEEKQVRPEDLMQAMRTNFASNPLLRHILLNRAPKYGNDHDQADEMVAYAGRHYCACVRQYHNLSGGAYRPGLFCLSSNTPLGRQVCALPSGREAGMPLGDGGISPKHGMDILGPTAAAKSVAKVDHKLASNGVNFNLKFMPTMLKTPEDRQKLTDLIRGYFVQ